MQSILLQTVEESGPSFGVSLHDTLLKDACCMKDKLAGLHRAKPCFIKGSASRYPPCHSIAYSQTRQWQFYSVLPETAGKYLRAGLRYYREFNRRGSKPKEVFCSIPIFPSDFNHPHLTSEQGILLLVTFLGHNSQLWSASFF